MPAAVDEVEEPQPDLVLPSCSMKRNLFSLWRKPASSVAEVKGPDQRPIVPAAGPKKSECLSLLRLAEESESRDTLDAHEKKDEDVGNDECKPGPGEEERGKSEPCGTPVSKQSIDSSDSGCSPKFAFPVVRFSSRTDTCDCLLKVDAGDGDEDTLVARAHELSSCE